MLAIVKFVDGRYGVMNTITGFILEDGDGEYKFFKSEKKAKRYAIKVEHKLIKAIHNVMKEK